MDDTPIPENDIANNVRLSRCFFYVSEILGQVCENGGVGKVERTIPFSITPAQLADFETSPYSISGSEISKKLAALVNNPQMKTFSVPKLNQWLIGKGLLYETVDPLGKTRKIPTEQGKAVGISAETKMGREGEYIAVLFDAKAQRFIVNNIYEILNA